MPELKIQEAQLLFKKIYANPKNYNLKILDGSILGMDEKISFKFFKGDEKCIFEVVIDDMTFTNTTGEWNNAFIMLKNAIKKIQKEKETQKVELALNKLRQYISE